MGVYLRSKSQVSRGVITPPRLGLRGYGLREVLTKNDFRIAKSANIHTIRFTGYILKSCSIIFFFLWGGGGRGIKNAVRNRNNIRNEEL